MPMDIHGICPLLSVFDMRKSIRFYRDVLGFEMITTSPKLSDDPDHVNWAWMRLHDAELMLNTAYDPEDQPEEPAKFQFVNHGDVCLYFGCPDPDAAYKFLREKGVEAKEPTVAPYGMKQLYFNDPDGYGLCFQCKA